MTSDPAIQQYSRELESMSGPPLTSLGSIPNEILSLIFLFCSLDHQEDVPRWQDPPLLLALVSRQWKDVAYTTPELWSKIVLRFIGVSPANPLHRDPVIAWLSRARGAPLDVIITCRTEVSPEEEVLEEAIIMEVVRRAKKLRRMSCEVNLRLTQALSERFFSSTAESRQFQEDLESLTLEVSTGDDSPFEVDFSAASKLERADIGANIQAIIRDDHTLHSLQELSIPAPKSAFDHIRHLRLLPTLIDYAGRLSITQSIPPSLGTQVSHTRLESFSLMVPADHPSVVGSLLDQLVMPNLRNLSLTSFRRAQVAEVHPWPNLASFLRHSGSHLETLDVWHLPMTDSEYTASLRYTPQLRVLKMDTGRSMSDEMLRMLTCWFADQDPAVDLVPLVEEMSLNGGRCSGALYKEVIRSRWGGPGGFFTSGRLRCIIFGDSEFESSDLEDCISGGLDVYMPNYFGEGTG